MLPIAARVCRSCGPATRGSGAEPRLAERPVVGCSRRPTRGCRHALRTKRGHLHCRFDEGEASVKRRNASFRSASLGLFPLVGHGLHSPRSRRVHACAPVAPVKAGRLAAPPPSSWRGRLDGRVIRRATIDVFGSGVRTLRASGLRDATRCVLHFLWWVVLRHLKAARTPQPPSHVRLRPICMCDLYRRVSRSGAILRVVDTCRLLVAFRPRFVGDAHRRRVSDVFNSPEHRRGLLDVFRLPRRGHPNGVRVVRLRRPTPVPPVEHRSPHGRARRPPALS